MILVLIVALVSLTLGYVFGLMAGGLFKRGIKVFMDEQIDDLEKRSNTVLKSLEEQMIISTKKVYDSLKEKHENSEQEEPIDPKKYH